MKDNKYIYKLINNIHALMTNNIKKIFTIQYLTSAPIRKYTFNIKGDIDCTA